MCVVVVVVRMMNFVLHFGNEEKQEQMHFVLHFGKEAKTSRIYVKKFQHFFILLKKIAKLQRERSHFENTTAGQDPQTIILQMHLGNRNGFFLYFTTVFKTVVKNVLDRQTLIFTVAFFFLV